MPPAAARVASPARRHRRARRDGRAPRRARRSATLLLIVFVLIVLIPLYVLSSPASSAAPTSTRRPAVEPAHRLDPRGWSQGLGRAGARRSSAPFDLAIPVALISSILGSLNGFVLSRWRFPGADVVFTLILFGMFIPYQAVMIPLQRRSMQRRSACPRRHPDADRRAHASTASRSAR